MALFENYDRRIAKINGVIKEYGIGSVEECREICKAAGFDPYEIAKGIQPICFENVCWAYCVGAAIALKAGAKNAEEAARYIGIGLQSFCIDGSVAENRKVGLGHGNLAAMLLSDESKCFAFLAGHESFAAAEGAIGIVRNANKVRKQPLRVILNGLGKDAAQIISRINGFTYVQTQFDYFTDELKIVREIRYSEGERANHHALRGRGRVHHRQLHQPHPVPAPRGRHLQEGVHRAGQEVLLRGFRRRHGPYPPSRQHGCRPRLLRHDRHHGPHAFRRPVRRLLLRACARGDDGVPRHGQQPHGGRHRGRGRGGPEQPGQVNQTRTSDAPAPRPEHLYKGGEL